MKKIINLFKPLLLMGLILLLVPNTVFSQTVVSADKMNILYANLENPVSVAVTGMEADNTIIEVEGATKRKIGTLQYMITPSKAYSTVKIRVYFVNGDKKELQGCSEFRVLPIPPGTVRIANVLMDNSSHTIRLNALRSNPYVLYTLEGFEFQVKYRVLSFTVVYTVEGKTMEEEVQGNKIPTEILASIASQDKPALVSVKDIVVVGPEGEKQLRTLPYKFEVQ